MAAELSLDLKEPFAVTMGMLGTVPLERWLVTFRDAIQTAETNA